MSDIEAQRSRAAEIWRHAVSASSRNLPGALASAAAAVAAASLATYAGVPVMLVALLLGMTLNVLSRPGRCAAGIDFTSTYVLKTAVALLGAQVAVADLAALGSGTIATIGVTVAVTIAFGAVLAPLAGLDRRLGALTGGAVAICGASAALAIAAVLPRTATTERDTVFTIIGVTTLSTLAMVAYPMIASAMHLDDRAAGIFLGGAIHDVAQVAGAGFSVSSEAGNVAVLTKLLRVVLLLPAVYVLGLMFAAPDGESGKRRLPAVPPFVIGFAALAALNSLQVIPPQVMLALKEISQWGLVAAIVALGMKTSVTALLSVGARPVLLMIAETAWLAALVAAALVWIQI